MGGSYPMPADYRRRGRDYQKPATERRRPPGKTFRSRPQPVRRPVIVPATPKAPPRPPVKIATTIPGWARFLTRANPYLWAFELGFMAGLWLFGSRPNTLLIRNPGGWEEYICPGYGGSGIGALQRSGTVYPQVLGTDGANCISGQFVAGDPGPNVDFGVWEDYGVFIRRRHRVTFGIGANGDPALTPEARVGTAAVQIIEPVFEDWVAPAIWSNPLLRPVGAPAVWARPAPIWMPSRPSPSPGVGPEGYQAGNGLPGLGGLPVEPGGEPSVVVRPRGRPAVRPQANPGRPGRGVRERKIKGARALWLAGQGMNYVTETGDFVEALYKSFDKKCLKAKGVSAPRNTWRAGSAAGRMGEDGRNWHWRPGHGWRREVGYYQRVSLQDQALALYKHVECIDVAKAVTNVIANQIEDRILGSLGKQSKRASQTKRPHGALPFGFEVGPAL